MYLQKTDYKTRISTDLLDLVIAEGSSNGDDLLATASKIAEDTINSTAGVLYDFNAEFAATGGVRNGKILSWALSIAVYELYQRVPDANVPQKAIKNYDDTMTELSKCAMGKFPLKLPTAVQEPLEGSGPDGPVEGDGNGLRRIGGPARRSHKY